MVEIVVGATTVSALECLVAGYADICWVSEFQAVFAHCIFVVWVHPLGFAGPVVAVLGGLFTRDGSWDGESWLLSKVAIIAMKLPFDLLFSLCSRFLRNLTVVGVAAILAAICLLRFLRYSSSCWSWVLVVPRSKVGTVCMRNVIPNWHSLVVLYVFPTNAEICERRASMLAFILDAGALGAVVITILPFLLWRTPRGSASLLLHLVSSSVIILCSSSRVGEISAWLLVVTIRSRSSLEYVFACAGGAADACCYSGVPAAVAAAWAKVFAFPLPLPVTSTQSSAWIQGALEGAGVLGLGGCCSLGGCCTSCAYSIVV